MQGGLQGGGLNVNSLQLQGSTQGGVAAETSMVCRGGGWCNTRQPGGGCLNELHLCQLEQAQHFKYNVTSIHNSRFVYSRLAQIVSGLEFRLFNTIISNV